jgi:hypothetical protein
MSLSRAVAVLHAHKNTAQAQTNQIEKGKRNPKRKKHRNKTSASCTATNSCEDHTCPEAHSGGHQRSAKHSRSSSEADRPHLFRRRSSIGPQQSGSDPPLLRALRTEAKTKSEIRNPWCMEEGREKNGGARTPTSFGRRNGRGEGRFTFSSLTKRPRRTSVPKPGHLHSATTGTDRQDPPRPGPNLQRTCTVVSEAHHETRREAGPWSIESADTHISSNPRPRQMDPARTRPERPSHQRQEVTARRAHTRDARQTAPAGGKLNPPVRPTAGPANSSQPRIDSARVQPMETRQRRMYGTTG